MHSHAFLKLVGFAVVGQCVVSSSPAPVHAGRVTANLRGATGRTASNEPSLFLESQPEETAPPRQQQAISLSPIPNPIGFSGVLPESRYLGDDAVVENSTWLTPLELPQRTGSQGQSEDNTVLPGTLTLPALQTSYGSESSGDQFGVIPNYEAITDRQALNVFQNFDPHTQSPATGNLIQMDVAGEGFVPHLESAQGHSTTELAEPSAPSESSATSPLPPNSSMSFGDQETVTAAPNDEFDSVRAENVGPVDVNENQMSGDVSQEVLPAEPQQAKDDANPSVKVLPEEALNSEKENERLQVDPEGNGVLDSRLDDAAQTDSEGDREVDSPALIEIGDDKDRDGAPGEGGDRLPSTTENSRKEVDPLKENSAAFEEEEKTQKQLDTEKEADQAEVSPANPEASPSMTPPAAEPSTAETGGTPETAETHEKMVNGRAPSSSGDSDTPVPEPAEESEKAYEPGVVSVNAYPSSVSGAASDGDLNRDQHGTVVSSSELPQSSTSFEDADLDGEVPTSRHAGEGIAAVPSFTDGHSHTPHSSDTASGLLEPIPLSHQDMEVVNEVRESHQLAHIVDDAERGILADHQLQNGSTALLGVLPEAGASHEPVHHGEHSFALEGSVFAERPETHGVPHTGPLEYSHGMIPTSTAHEVPVGVIVHGGVTSAPGPAQTHLLPPMAAAMHAIQSPFLSHETNTAYSAPMHAKSAAGKYVTVPAAPTTLVKSDEVVASSRGGKKKGGKNKKNSSAVVYEASPGPLIPEQKTTMYVAEPTYLEVQEKPKKRSRRVPM